MADVKKAVPADAQRTEITPLPYSFVQAWDLNTQDQEALSTLLAICPNFIPTLQEEALSMVAKAGMSGDYCAGVQEGGRSLLQKILNMTKERVTHRKGKHLQHQAAQVGAGMPGSRSLRPPPVVTRERLSGPLPPKPPESPPDQT